MIHIFIYLIIMNINKYLIYKVRINSNFKKKINRLFLQELFYPLINS
jgi:hypothetical protein